MHAAVPLQRGHRIQVADAGARVGLSPAHRVTAGTGQRSVGADLHAPVDTGQLQRGLTAEHRLGEGVARRQEQQVGGGVEAGDDAPAAREVAACVGADRGVVVHRAERPARARRHRGEAAELPRQPEAHAAFIGCRGPRREQAGQHQDSQRPRAGAGRQFEWNIPHCRRLLSTHRVTPSLRLPLAARLIDPRLLRAVHAQQYQPALAGDRL